MLTSLLWTAALGGTALVLLSTVLDTDVLGVDLSEAGDPGTGWGILGLRGLIWGSAIGGWMGLALQWTGQSPLTALSVAAVGALATAAGVNLLLARLGRDAGGEMPSDAMLIGERADLVLAPTAEAPGVARLVVGGQLREFPAQAPPGALALQPGPVIVTEVEEGLLVVTPA